MWLPPGMGGHPRAAEHSSAEDLVSSQGDLWQPGSSILVSKTRTTKKPFLAQKVTLFQESNGLLAILSTTWTEPRPNPCHVDARWRQSLFKDKGGKSPFQQRKHAHPFQIWGIPPSGFLWSLEVVWNEDHDFQNSLTRNTPLPQSLPGKQWDLFPLAVTRDTSSRSLPVKMWQKCTTSWRGTTSVQWNVTGLPFFLGSWHLPA